MGSADGHGTHCAGTIGGKTYGIAKDVTLHAVRVLDADGSGSYDAVIGGVDYAAGERVAAAEQLAQACARARGMCMCI